MKKIFALALAVVMLATLGTAFAVSADEPEMFWVTHYNDSTVEGAGSIITQPYEHAGWWLHVAFKPIEGATNAYEIVEICNGLADGSATPLAIPEGGFVWAANYGNDYITLGSGDTDFTSPNCSDAIDRAKAWAVGDQYVIEGVDFETVPTSTPDVNWYDDAYVCTATIAPYVPGSEPSDEPESSEPEAESSEEAVESSEEAVESSEAPVTSSEAPKTGDAGILVFAVLAVVAIAGCAIAVKVRG